MENKIRLCNLLLLFIFIPSSLFAYSLRQFSSKNGLSNSAILSMCQDRNGFIWFGSCDGLNMFDGVNFQVYKPTHQSNHLSGNLIESILESEEDILWIQTNYGLDRFDSRQRTISTFKEFKGKNRLLQSKNHDIYVMREDNFISYYEPSENAFYHVYLGNISFEDILEMRIDRNNVLWIFSADGNHRSFSILRNENGVFFTSENYFSHNESVLWCFYEDDVFYFVDDTYALYEYDIHTKDKRYIYNIGSVVLKKGEISSIIKYHSDYFIGFKSSGLVRLHNDSDSKNRFSVYDIDIKSGIFCLMKDKFQDIVWVGTDGQGAYMYFVEPYSLKSVLYRDLKYSLSNPVRTLFIDKERTLWIGTKGDGIVKIYNYNVMTNSGSGSEHILMNNSLLTDNSVYAVASSKKNILWIGTEGGINYYSYKDRKIKNLHVEADGKPVKYVHSICEYNDSTLWIATVGEGFVRVSIKGTRDNPVITGCQRFTTEKSKQSLNYFFTTYQESDSIIWFGNRGYGAYKINTLTEETTVLTFDKDDTNQTLNDIFSITKNNKGYWFGTSYGLVNYNDNQTLVFNELNGFPNNTIHGILQDNYDNLWLSTNRGMVKFNINNNTFQTYKQMNNLEVTEFSDGAYFKDEPTGALFFGGINGYIAITKNEFSEYEYVPRIYFNRFTIYGHEYNFNDFLKRERGKEKLELTYEQNFFSISFSALDYINGNDYTYLYKLNELSDTWIEADLLNSAAFTNISPGDYTLQVKYKNNITGNESEIQSLYISILPPWYRTNAAYFIYSFLFLIIIVLVAWFTRKWYLMKQNAVIEKLNQQQKEEVYESKLRFFTNITHELCTPLTLIYGPCERIISYEKSDEYVSKYANLIQYNAEKLNTLIQELIEFRRLETGYKSLDIRRISVSELVQSIANSFEELADTKGIDYSLQIQENVVWNSDSSSLNKVVTNLISNAFKYTEEKGKISVELFVENEKLQMIVSNTGKGIKEENLSKIFDRYTVLDNFEIQKKGKISPRNGLGLAICNSMVKLLKGEIVVTSIPDKVTTFKVILPAIESDSEFVEENDVIEIKRDQQHHELDFSVMKQGRLPEFDRNKQTIMVIDDDISMLWFVTEVLLDKYNVIPVNDSEEVITSLRNKQPNLIISDIMMPGIDGLSLAKSIKSDKLLSHIPLILLSAKNTVEDQVQGIDSGAEAYITKPFNIEYLEKVISRLIQRKEDLKEYYNSVLSSFELNEGKIAHKEDKDFFEKLLETIDTNISNPDLSVDLLSTSLGYSTRQLYRKLKNVTDSTPNDIIKEYRLVKVEKLLITTNLSVDEILYKAGFTNRGNFFKIFSQKYGMTPKSFREQKKKEVNL